jgi:rod shape-determining protein MreC
MKQLFRSTRELVLLIVVLFVHLVLLSTQVTRAQTTPLLRSWTMEVAAPMLKGFVGSFTVLSRIWYSYIDLRQTREENLRLKEQIAQYQQAVVRYEQKIKQLDRLQTLDELETSLNMPAVKARIIGGDSNQWYSSRIIDQGGEAGIARDSPVICPEGVVGRVVHLSRKSAVVQLITDADSGVGVLLENSRAQGVLRGEGKKTASIDYIETNAKVLVGEKVLTSGLDQIYPKGLLVGYVTSVGKRQIFQDVDIAISADVQKLEEVLVLKKEPQS